jgi:hypothetical protein
MKSGRISAAMGLIVTIGPVIADHLLPRIWVLVQPGAFILGFKRLQALWRTIAGTSPETTSAPSDPPSHGGAFLAKGKPALDWYVSRRESPA